MDIATWNVNSLNVRLPHVLQWLQQHPQTSILALQELKTDHSKFPLEAFADIGYQAIWSGQKTYNGVAIISKTPATEIIYDIPCFEDEQKRVITATFGDTRVINVYCVNGEAVGSEKFAYKERWFAALTNHIANELKKHNKLVVLGDFNIAPNDIDVYDPKAWQGKILCSEPERQWFQNLLDLGLSDSQHTLAPDTPAYTWWDYRMNMFKRKLGLRIDHILITPALKETLQQITVDTEARSWERPSDHAPVFASFKE